MTKLCPRGKAAAKRKFKVYPSAYANAYASKICAGKIKDPSGTKRKDWGPKKAKVGMAVTAGAQSGMGRLQKSGLTKAKKGKMMIMVAVGKPKKANKGAIMKVANKLEKASKAMKDRMSIFLPLGVMYAKEHELEKAAKIFRQVISAHPNAWKAHRNLGIVYEMMGNSEFAQKFLKRAESLKFCP